MTREFREDLSEEMTFQQEPEEEGASHGENGGWGQCSKQGTGSAKALRLELTKQAHGTASLQFCEEDGAGNLFSLNGGQTKAMRVTLEFRKG